MTLAMATLTFCSVLDADACTFLLASAVSTALVLASRATICTGKTVVCVRESDVTV